MNHDRIFKVAAIRAAFPKIRLPHPQTSDVIERIEEMRQTFVLNPNGVQRLMMLLAPTQAGKSTAIEQHIHQIVIPEIAREQGLAPEQLTADERRTIFEAQKRVVWITLQEKTSVKGFAGDLLAGLGDCSPDTGPGSTLRRRAKHFLKAQKTQLLVIDEIYHLVDRDEKARTNKTVADAIKTLIITAHCPVVVAGIDEAGPLLRSNLQLGFRNVEPFTIPPLDYGIEGHRKMFLTFLGMMAIEVAKIRGPSGAPLFPGVPDFVSDDLPVRIHDVCKGFVGRATRFIEEACVIAVRRGSDKIQREDFAEATTRWAMATEIHVGRDPFADADMPLISGDPNREQISSRKTSTRKPSSRERNAS
jgi:hypothetical protein